MAEPAQDRRWKTFNEKGFACSCGERHVGLFPIHMEVPIGWPGSRDYAPDDALRMDGNFLSANFCVRDGKHFYLRCRLPFQMTIDPAWAFTYTVWAYVDRPAFETYVDDRAKGKLDNSKRMTARLSNKLSGWPDSANLAGTAVQEANTWPTLIIHGLQAPALIEHPLMVQQHAGIDLDRALELFVAYDHDMRSAAGSP